MSELLHPETMKVSPLTWSAVSIECEGRNVELTLRREGPEINHQLAILGQGREVRLLPTEKLTNEDVVRFDVAMTHP